jgi:YidC/Oxa1 family membrane protein insertase
MDIIGTALGTPLGYIMKFCYDLIKNYGIAIIVFTLFTKVILFPVSLMVQKDSIKMIKMKPKLDAFKYQYVDDKDALFEAQNTLYKEEKYNPFTSVIPLLIQIPIIFGLIDVVYRPMKHLLHFPQATIDAFVAKAGQILGTADLGSSPELVVIKCIGDPNNRRAFLSLQNGTLKGSNVADLLSRMQSIHMNFLGFDLSATPNFFHLDILFLIPVLAGVSALMYHSERNQCSTNRTGRVREVGHDGFHDCVFVLLRVSRSSRRGPLLDFWQPVFHTGHVYCKYYL